MRKCPRWEKVTQNRKKKKKIHEKKVGNQKMNGLGGHQKTWKRSGKGGGQS